MASADGLLQALLHQTACLGAACLAVMLLRPLLGRCLGAHAAYLAWAAVPSTLLAAAAAQRSVADVAPVQALSMVLAPAAAAVPAWPAPAGTAAACLVAAWVVGAAGLGVLALRSQRRFESMLHVAAPHHALGPVVVGVWRPRLWLPADFDQRFCAAERALILAHERVHLCRRDNAWNLLAFTLLVLHWFNPLAWWAWRRMRRDQELSCDALALARGLAAGDAAAPARYVRALLSAQGQGVGLWQAGPAGAPFFSHPLVERIHVLKTRPLPLPRRLAATRVVALAAALFAGAVAAALETVPAAPLAVTTQIEVQVDGRTVAAPQVLGRTGQPMTVALDDAAGTGRLAITLALSPAAGDHLQIDATLRGGPGQKVFASPRLITRDRTPARVDTTLPGSGRSLSVTFAPARQ